MSRAPAFEIDGRERARPIPAPGAVVEDCLTGPGRGRARIGAHRILQRRRMVAGAPRLDMQAAQANAERFRIFKHRVIGRDGPRPVSGELSRLGLQKLGHRLVADQPVRVVSVFGRTSRVSRANREHAARQSLETSLTPARLSADRNQRRNAENEAQKCPNDRNRNPERKHGAESEQQGDFVFLAPPGDVHDARIVRKPRQASRDQRQRRQENQQANHRDPASNAKCAPEGA